MICDFIYYKDKATKIHTDNNNKIKTENCNTVNIGKLFYCFVQAAAKLLEYKNLHIMFYT